MTADLDDTAKSVLMCQCDDVSSTSSAAARLDLHLPISSSLTIEAELTVECVHLCRKWQRLAGGRL
eukprot:scaffold154_cov185-Alexandrium_tamarense.AAC.2